jgi:hypothetical protein
MDVRSEQLSSFAVVLIAHLAVRQGGIFGNRGVCRQTPMGW